MEATKTRGNPSTRATPHSNEGIAKIFSRRITVNTTERTDLVNLTDDLRAFVESTGVDDGYVQISSLHTTAGILMNEWQDALLSDIKAMIEQIVPRTANYRHNDPEFSDCDRHNADSHLRNVVVGQSLSVPISKGKLVLGQWQSVILAEFDGPNQRTVFFQVFGV
jgi:secondary thiamine-phosphate synthase enzyme